MTPAPRAMILAAGRGNRLRPTTDRTPKPLIEVAGRRLIEHHIAGLRSAGVREVVINLGWLGDRIRDALGNGSGLGVDIAYSEEGWPALETGGGIHNALPLLGPRPFIVVNGDVFAGYPWGPLVQRATTLQSDVLAHLVLVPNPEHHPGGDFALDGERIRNPEPGFKTFTFSGISIHRPELFSGCEAGHFPMLPLWREAAERGKLTGELFDGTWSDVGTPERLEALRASPT